MDLFHLFGVLVFFGAIFFAAFLELTIFLWVPLLGLILIGLTGLGWLGWGAMSIFWPGYLLATGFVVLRSLRIKYLLKPLLPSLKRKLPPISHTERQAIEAGNTWWEKELFNGAPNWRLLFNYTKPTLSLEEQAFIDTQVESLCSMINDWEMVGVEKNMPNKIWEYLKQERFFGIVIPKEYGGLGFSAFAHSSIIMKIASRSISAAVNTMVPNSLGPGELLLHYGTTEQKAYYLPRLARGEDIPCFALTAPDAGSDAGSIPDRGIVCKGTHEGKEVLGIRLSWDKRYITLAPVATLLGLAIHLYDPDHLVGTEDDVGITLCLIPTTHPGVEIGRRHYPLYASFMNGPTRGNEVFIPMDWIIGGPKKAGQGWQMLMECLSIGRAISLPALATASSKVAYRYTGAYARVRRQFNVPIAQFEGIQESLGYIAGYTYILEACRQLTTTAVDLKLSPSTASAMSKYHMTELARQSINHAMDVHAGQMIQVGPRNFLANIYLTTPISITVEGANILTRNLIIFGQGAIRCHPYLLKEVSLISSEETDLKQLDSVLMSHVGRYISHFLRNMAYGVTNGRWIRSSIANKRVRVKHKQLTRMSTALALFADTSFILLGGSLKRRELISARLGDIHSQLYLASAVLKFYQDSNKTDDETNYAEWALQYCLFNIQKSCKRLLYNYPQKWVGKLLYWLTFPFGSVYSPPHDHLHAMIVNPMLSSTDFRDRLTSDIAMKGEDNDPYARLDHAMSKIEEIEPILKKWHKAVQTGAIHRYLTTNQQLQVALQAGIVTQEEARKLTAYISLHEEIIKVNEFSFDLKQVLT